MHFENEHVSCDVQPQYNGADSTHITIQGMVANPAKYAQMEVFAAHPIDRRASYSGSGLPFPCPKTALKDTPNRTVVNADGTFSAMFSYPNSYYTTDGFTKIKPSIFVALKPTNPREEPVLIRFELPENPILFFRTLTHRPGRTGPDFYGDKDTLLDPIPRTAEQVMRAFIEYKAKYDKAV